jgi:hypothetical protein
MDGYRQAKRYAFKLDPNNYKDICHDAYLSYYKQKQCNLFLEPPGIISNMIKWTTFDYWKRKSWSFNKENQGVRQFSSFSDGDEMLADRANHITPIDELVASELLNRFVKLTETTRDSRAVFTKNIEIIRKILQLRLQSFTNKEIAEELGVSKSLITYYINQTDLNKIRLV